MDHRNALVRLFAALVLFVCGQAHAGYALPTPPAGWSGASGGSPMRYLPPANASRFVAGSVATNVAVNVGGRSVVVPASLRVAANAATFLVPQVRVIAGIALATGVAAWLMDNYGLSWDDAHQKWIKTTDGSTQCVTSNYPGFETGCHSINAIALKHLQDNGCSGATECNLVSVGAVPASGYGVVSYEGSRNNFNGYYGTWSCCTAVYGSVAVTVTTSPSATVRDAVESDWVGPTTAPGSGIPDAALNDMAEELPIPVALPAVEPMRVPMGEPLPVPGTDPAEWRQPVTDIVPAPILTEPWRVDLQPKDLPSNSPDGLPGPTPIEEDDPAGTPSEDAKTDCDKYPDASGCLPLDTPDSGDQVEQHQVNVSVTPDGGWGADNAACPAARSVTVQGRVIPIPFDLFCTYFSGLRYVVIAMAWLGAGFILLGAREN
jgi:hypothetical protein